MSESKTIHYSEGGSIAWCGKVVPSIQTAITEEIVTCPRCRRILCATNAADSIGSEAKKIIKQAVEDAVAEEREACAEIIRAEIRGWLELSSESIESEIQRAGSSAIRRALALALKRIQTRATHAD